MTNRIWVRISTFAVFTLSAMLCCSSSQEEITATSAIEQEKVSTAKMTKDDLFLFREEFIRKFQRIPMNSTRDDALFLRIMIQSMKAKRGVEIGSANGYGAIHMGMGFEHTGGHLHTIDIDPGMVKQCRENIEKVHLQKTVTCIEGDALQELPKLEGVFDFVFIDAVKRDYFNYFKAIHPKLRPGAVIVADNVIAMGNQMKDFLDAMESDPDYDMLIFQASREKNDGMAVIYKKK